MTHLEEADLRHRLERAEARVRDLEIQTTGLVAVAEKARDALGQLWAGIGDALMSGIGIERGYAKSVAARVKEAEDAVEVAVEPFVRERRRNNLASILEAARLRDGL